MTALGSLLLCRLLTCWSVLRTRVDSEAYVQVFFRAKARQSCVCNLIQTCGPTETKLQTHSSRGANLTQPPLCRDCMHTSTLCEATSRLASLWTWWLWLRCWTAQLEQGVIERGRLSFRGADIWLIQHKAATHFSKGELRILECGFEPAYEFRRRCTGQKLESAADQAIATAC